MKVSSSDFLTATFSHFIPSHYVRRRFLSVSALEFCCCREIPFLNQKQTFGERISCVTRHEDFLIRSDRIVSLQVASFLRDCKGRGHRRDRRAGQTERKTSEITSLISGKGFNFITNDIFLLVKYGGNYNW